jgi:hypothetical protein
VVAAGAPAAARGRDAAGEPDPAGGCGGRDAAAALDPWRRRFPSVAVAPPGSCRAPWETPVVVASRGAQLVVVGAGRPVTDAVLQHARGPVLVVRR